MMTSSALAGAPVPFPSISLNTAMLPGHPGEHDLCRRSLPLAVLERLCHHTLLGSAKQGRTGTNPERHVGTQVEPTSAICRHNSQRYDPGEALPMGLSLLRLYLAQTKTKPTAASLRGRYCIATQNTKELLLTSSLPVRVCSPQVWGLLDRGPHLLHMTCTHCMVLKRFRGGKD